MQIHAFLVTVGEDALPLIHLGNIEAIMVNTVAGVSPAGVVSHALVAGHRALQEMREYVVVVAVETESEEGKHV